MKVKFQERELSRLFADGTDSAILETSALVKCTTKKSTSFSTIFLSMDRRRRASLPFVFPFFYFFFFLIDSEFFFF